MCDFELEIWYYFVAFGEVEKDFETHTIEANSIEEAVEKAKLLYKTIRSIYHKNVKVY